MSRDAESEKSPVRQEVPVAWETLEDAFENNAPEVHSFLNVETGDVIRVVDGIADPVVVARMGEDPQFMRVDPVSSREQYRWMERYIATVEDAGLQQLLAQAIDGKGAFRRFKDVLMNYAVDRERWFVFRSERLKTAIETWLDAHGLVPVEREAWEVPTTAQVEAVLQQREEQPRSAAHNSRAAAAEASRQRLHQLCDLLPVRELDSALTFLEFLRERRPTPRSKARGATESTTGAADSLPIHADAKDGDDSSH